MSDRTVAEGIYLRGTDNLQIKFRVSRLPAPNRVTINLRIPSYSARARTDAMELRARLVAACERPGSDDRLLMEHLPSDWLDRLGVSAAQDVSLEAAVVFHMELYESSTKNTKASAQRECNAILEHFGRHKMLSSFRNEHSQVRKWIIRPGHSEAWRKKTGGRLRRLLEDARKDGILDTHPLQATTWFKDAEPARNDRSALLRAAVSKSRPAQNRAEAFTGAEIDAILSQPTERTDELAMVATGFATGMRTGELMALAAEDVDLEAGVIHVSWNWSACQFGLPKFNKQRIVPLPADSMWLRRQLRKHEGDTVLEPVEIDGELYEVERTYLFRNTAKHFNNERQRQLTGRDVIFRGNDTFGKFFWKPHLEAAGVEYRPPYTMRHTYATNAIEVEGLDYRDLAAFMGHTDPDVTRRRYVRTRAEDDIARAQRVAANRKPQRLRSIK